MGAAMKSRAPEELIQELLHDADGVDSLGYLLMLLFHVIGIVAAGCFVGLAAYFAILILLH